MFRKTRFALVLFGSLLAAFLLASCGKPGPSDPGPGKISDESVIVVRN